MSDFERLVAQNLPELGARSFVPELFELFLVGRKPFPRLSGAAGETIFELIPLNHSLDKSNCAKIGSSEKTLQVTFTLPLLDSNPALGIRKPRKRSEEGGVQKTGK